MKGLHEVIVGAVLRQAQHLVLHASSNARSGSGSDRRLSRLAQLLDEIHMPDSLGRPRSMIATSEGHFAPEIEPALLHRRPRRRPRKPSRLRRAASVSQQRRFIFHQQYAHRRLLENVPWDLMVAGPMSRGLLSCTSATAKPASTSDWHSPTPRQKPLSTRYRRDAGPRDLVHLTVLRQHLAQSGTPCAFPSSTSAPTAPCRWCPAALSPPPPARSSASRGRRP